MVWMGGNVLKIGCLRVQWRPLWKKARGKHKKRGGKMENQSSDVLLISRFRVFMVLIVKGNFEYQFLLGLGTYNTEF
jgi:hypothetical protein